MATSKQRLVVLTEAQVAQIIRNIEYQFVIVLILERLLATSMPLLQEMQTADTLTSIHIIGEQEILRIHGQVHLEGILVWIKDFEFKRLVVVAEGCAFGFDLCYISSSVSDEYRPIISKLYLSYTHPGALYRQIWQYQRRLLLVALKCICYHHQGRLIPQE